MTQAPPPLQSTTYVFDDVLEVNEFYQEKGWTDGLPAEGCAAVSPAAASALAGLATLPQRRSVYGTPAHGRRTSRHGSLP